MKQGSLGLVLGCASVLSGCGRTIATLPYDVSNVVSAERPTHEQVLAVVKLEDARLPGESPDSEGRFIYRKVEYRGTVLDHLGLDPAWEVTQVLARHLAKARVFARVLVVRKAEHAPGADLFLSGRIVRLRGYVEAETEKPEVKVLAEVHLADLAITDGRERPPLARFDVGYSFHDVRSATPEPPDPWTIAGEVLAPALDQLVRASRRSRLDGRFRVERAVPPSPRLDLSGSKADVARALAGMAPSGWAFTMTSTQTNPTGWRAPQRCASGAFEATQEHGFHRVLGPFVPTLELWWCSKDLSLTWSSREEFPAVHLGEDGHGRRWFGRQLGKSSWKDGPGTFAERAQLIPPPTRYLFRLEPSSSAVPR